MSHAPAGRVKWRKARGFVATRELERDLWGGACGVGVGGWCGGVGCVGWWGLMSDVERVNKSVWIKASPYCAEGAAQQQERRSRSRSASPLTCRCR